jgi:hypothetical protein
MFKTTLINLIVLIGLLLLLETCSWSILAYSGKSQPFFIDPTMGFAQGMQASDKFKVLRHLDPLLAWGYDPQSISTKNNLENEYAVFGAADSRAFRIVFTGGSTTDSFTENLKWPIKLTEKLREAGYCVRSYVGGVSGYTSNQEMMKIVRDQYALQPQLHISYTGVNENEKEWDRLSSPYMITLLEKMVTYRRAPILPNTLWLLGDFNHVSKGQVLGVNHGLHQPHALPERLYNNLRRMHAFAKEFDYTFIGILQPMLGIGKYKPSAVELARIKDMNLVAEWGPFYEEAQRTIEGKPYLHNFVNIFENQSDLYTDDCHVTDAGDNIIAEKMYELLVTQYSKLLKAAQIQGCRD